jgi:tetratricopeptide (TPR) repeat protein
MAKQLADQIGFPLGGAAALYNLSRLHVERGEYRAGTAGLMAALDTFRRIGARGPEVNTVSRLAEAHRRAHDLDSAISFAQESLWLANALGDEMNQGFSLTELGAAFYEKGDISSAKGYSERALEIHRRLNGSAQAGKTSIILAAIHRDRGETLEAESHARNAVAFCRDGRDIRGEASANNLLAEFLYAEARHDEAREAWSRSLMAFEDIGDPQAESVRSRLTELATALPLFFPEQTRPLTPTMPSSRATPRQ